MAITSSSIFITICISSLLIIALNYFISKTNKFKIFRTDFFAFLIAIIILRLIFPIELFFTKTIPASTIMNPIFSLLNYELITGVTVQQIILLIWLCGIIVFGKKFVQQIIVSYRIANRIQKKSSCYKASELLSNYEGKDYLIMISDLVSSPMVFGLNKIIFLPNIKFSQIDLNNIVLHEIQHIKNHDVFIKLFLNIIVIIYWWFPPIYLLQRNMSLFLEIRVDDQVTKTMSSDSRFNYAESLISVQKAIRNTNSNYKELVFSSFVNDSAEILSYRVNYLLDGNFIKKTNSIFLELLCILPFLSNMIILEPAFYNTEIIEGTLTNDELKKGYITTHSDGTYSLTINGETVEMGKRIPNDLIDLPVIDENERK